ncbi:MAG: ribosomal protein L13e [Candidatus Freyarchaeota archaeon]|nr:ribosomal protein L13e [Candidatus Jordarchaeia archaeon]MBS7267805.1 ribosomal protein L13e [Candidatus Jordarchaeia archaeon]
MSEIEPRVMHSQDSRKFRAGRGFSLGEISGAGLSVHEARRLSLRIDRRRKTTHEFNIDAIKTHIKEMKKKLEEKKAEETKKLPLEEAEKRAVSELTKIEGLNKKLAQKLFQNKIDSLEALSNAKAKDLAKKVGVSETRAQLWIEDAQVLTGKIKPEPKPEEVKEAPKEKVVEELPEIESADLTKIKGLTNQDAKKLAEIGILTLEDLALTEEEEIEEITQITKIPQDTIKAWIKEAKELTEKPKETAKPKKRAKAKTKKKA